MHNSEKKHDKESHLRSAFKGITWRIVGTCDTIIIAYFITGKVNYALSIGGLEVFTKIFVYYLHERAWQLIPRGTIRKLYSVLKIN